MDNETAAGEKLAVEKRRKAQEEVKLNRQKALDAAPPDDDSDVLDTLLEKLRNGDAVGRRARRTRPGATTRPSAPLSLTLDSSLPTGDTVDLARDMLARLQSDGFQMPASPTVPVSQRRRRRRTENAGDIPGSPLVTEIQEIPEETETETQ